MTVVYFEGHFIQEEEAKIPVSDRGFQIGDGAYAVVQVRDGVPFFLEAHLEQLKRQCLSFNLNMPSLDRALVEELIAFNHAYQGIWRLKVIITGGDSTEVGLPKREGRVLMVLKPFFPAPFKPLKMALFPVPYSNCHASFKSLANLNRFYMIEEARRLGLDDCVSVTGEGYLLEASFGNLFWVKDQKLMTPDPTLSLYYGITIKNVVGLAHSLGLEVHHVKITPDALPEGGAAFRTNTMHGIRPIIQIGSKELQRNAEVESLFLKGYEELLASHSPHQAARALPEISVRL